MENITDRTRNPFGMEPPCERYVPGYGDANADVHVIGDHPGRHGGVETGVPFTDSIAGERVQRVLEAVGLLSDPGDAPTAENLFCSYLHMCVSDEEPTPESYAEMERYFDTELRAITAHVLVPVGERAVRHVLEQFSTYPVANLDVQAVHATEISGGAWLIVPATDPVDWTDDDGDELIAALEAVLNRDYARESDLGRFLTDPDPYLVR
ncbi:MAG: uracil-DNA glycosylase family protein [Halobacteriota archaeon]